jgi:hypothetical protein
MLTVSVHVLILNAAKMDLLQLHVEISLAEALCLAAEQLV